MHCITLYNINVEHNVRRRDNLTRSDQEVDPAETFLVYLHQKVGGGIANGTQNEGFWTPFGDQ